MATSTLHRGRNDAQEGDLGALARHQRRRRVIPTAAIALLMLAASFVVFLSLEPKPQGHAVLVLAKDVVAGHELTRGDLRVSTVDAPGLPTISAGDQSTVLGRALAVSLPAGSLVSPALLVGSAGPLVGQAIVGAALKPGAFPPDLRPGARVQLYAGAGQPLTGATVYALQATGDAQTDTVVSLMVPAKAAGSVAAAAAAGNLALVWVTP